MNKKLNITKEYILDQPIEKSFSQLDEIVSSRFNNSKYSLFGDFVNVEPPEFILMAKWVSLGRPQFARLASTQISVRLYNIEGKIKFSVKTITNPGLLMLICVSFFQEQ